MKIEYRPMNKPLVGLLLGFILSVSGCSKGKDIEPTSEKRKINLATTEVRQPAGAGAFYPGTPRELKKIIQNYLKGVPEQKITGRVLGLICPHAGYIYSGPVAAYSFKQLAGKHYDRVIIIGPSHYIPFAGASVDTRDAWKTPLGLVEIDTKLANKIVQQHPAIQFYEPAHEREHSVEVEVPFLQMVLEDFRIIPIVLGDQSLKTCEILADAIFAGIKHQESSILLIASTDMSHYHPYAKACIMDSLCLKNLENYDITQLRKDLNTGKCELCGKGAVITVMLVAKKLGADNIQILKYANSGDTAGTKDRVVGYCAAAITSVIGHRSSVIGQKKMGGEMLNKEQETKLLRIARQTIETWLREQKKPEFSMEDNALKEECGAFVTLHLQGQLRGCIGNIVGTKPLWETVRDMAIESATADPRFSPVTPEEMKDIDIEISVLTPLKKVKSADEIVLGTDGVIVRKGLQQGVFLPQVATETGWDKETFLRHLCFDKAGLPQDAWKDRATELFVFQAQVFGEKK